MNRAVPVFIIAILFGFSCSNSRPVTTLDYTGYSIDKKLPVDSGMIRFLQPYSASMSATMNKVIGFSNDNMTKKQPESEIGNFMADCIKAMAVKKFNKPVDAGFINIGGIRTYMSKGNITIGKVFEIMPFDNLVILQQIRGSVFQQFLDRTASEGGWPVSAGLTMQIKNKQAVNVLIDGKPLDPNAIYTIANSDYVANGGDNCEMLKGVPQQNRGYLLRDAIIDYITIFTQQGQPVVSKLENRVTNAN